jgi:acyl-CoA thioesterase-1
MLSGKAIVITGSTSGVGFATARAAQAAGAKVFIHGPTADAVEAASRALGGVPVDTVRQNLDAIMEKLSALHLPVFVAGMEANRALGPDYVAAFDALYPALAKKYGATLYPFFLDGVAMDQKLNQPDLLHPNAAGVAVIVGKMLPAITAWLGKLA